MRTQARTSFEKDFYKLMNNSVFGKTMENIRNRVDIRLATKDKQVDKWIAQPNFKSRTIFTNYEHVMYEHVGLRSKMYASRSEVDPNNKEKSEFIKKSKGVNKSVVEHEIQFEDYVECLRQNKELLHTMSTIRSYNHNLYSVELNKISLSPHDNKRYILKDGISTLPWGHYAIPQDQTQDMEVDSALETK